MASASFFGRWKIIVVTRLTVSLFLWRSQKQWGWGHPSTLVDFGFGLIKKTPLPKTLGHWLQARNKQPAESQLSSEKPQSCPFSHDVFTHLHGGSRQAAQLLGLAPGLPRQPWGWQERGWGVEMMIFLDIVGCLEPGELWFTLG